MAELKNHPGYWLRDDAATQLTLLETHHGIITINSAGRTVAEQQELIDRWDRGGMYNRPPYLYEPARPPYNSNHVASGGIAIDTPDIGFMLDHGRPYGFIQPYSWDVVHFEFRPELVTKRPEKVAQTEKENDMPDSMFAIVDGVPSWCWLNWSTGELYAVHTQKEADWIAAYMGSVRNDFSRAVYNGVPVSDGGTSLYKSKLELFKILTGK